MDYLTCHQSPVVCRFQTAVGMGLASPWLTWRVSLSSSTLSQSDVVVLPWHSLPIWVHIGQQGVTSSLSLVQSPLSQQLKGWGGEFFWLIECLGLGLSFWIHPGLLQGLLKWAAFLSIVLFILLTVGKGMGLLLQVGWFLDILIPWVFTSLLLSGLGACCIRFLLGLF